MGIQGANPIAFYIWRVNNSLKQKKHCRLIYFECKLEANLFLYTSKQIFMEIESDSTKIIGEIAKKKEETGEYKLIF